MVPTHGFLSFRGLTRISFEVRLLSLRSALLALQVLIFFIVVLPIVHNQLATEIRPYGYQLVWLLANIHSLGSGAVCSTWTQTGVTEQ